MVSIYKLSEYRRSYWAFFILFLAPYTDDICNLISTPIGELARQSTIEENLDKMNLNQSHTG